MYISLTDIHQKSSLKEKEFPAIKNSSCMAKFLWQWCTSRNRNPLPTIYATSLAKTVVTHIKKHKNNISHRNGHFENYL